ncbi:tyrosine-protein kinase Drl [Anopheles maculipalpis]|uniref:tyrosine-protein kinase Drl n=1 Tax=Anopheles maculipalpis TaxID=1496333 RepID=UPI0021590A46|nr:tyrosine-protein kinase Drl [Anopheles maculipalpis]
MSLRQPFRNVIGTPSSTVWRLLLVTVLLCGLPRPVTGYFDLFLNHSEVIKLMGIEADLFYVRDGAVNDYAMSFVVPMKPGIDFLRFSWQSRTAYPLPYTISVHYDDNEGAVQHPELDIPTSGIIPRTVESFTVHLVCWGNVTKEVPVGIHLHVEGPPKHNDTKLIIKRNKICIKGMHPARNRLPAAEIAPQQGPALLGAAACALGLVLVVGLIASAMYVRARKQIRQDSLHTSFTTAAYGSHQNVFIRLDPLGRPPSANSGSYATIASLNKYPISESKKSWFRSTPSPSPYATALLPLGQNGTATGTESVYAKPESVCPSRVSYYASSQLTQVYSLSTPARSIHSNGSNPKDKLRRIAVSPGTIICQQLVQEGTYGRIYSGILHHPLGETRDVLIKTVVDGASLSQVAYLLSEGSTLCGISHPNILFPVAAVTELSGPPKVAYPLAAKGNLKLYLQSCREIGIQNSQLSTRQLVEFGLQVARGISHLHSLGVLHKDIATRNCVLDVELNVRVCDNALSRDVFPSDYHCLGDNENRPIKWMALETLEKKFFTASSDIWSLGVLLWELATLAAMPFEEVDCFELSAYLRDGYRLAQPVNCPDEFYTVMSCCWLADYKQRPSFPQLIAYLHDFHDDLGKYI